MNENKTYPKEFFQHLQKSAKKSAEQIVPVIVDLLSPESVVDVGCGTGTWLSEFRANGIEDIRGLDGDHVPREMLQIPSENFLPVDLISEVKLNRQFDVVISLEVAEHLPPESASTFVDSLAGLGDVIIFSAAIPFQGGDGHINEQWPAYWVKQFQERGFVFSNCIRTAIWELQHVEWWYAQNILMFYRPAALGRFEKLEQATLTERGSCSPLVHPRHYLQIKWDYKVLEAALDIVDLVPAGETFVFIDNDQTNYQFEPARTALKLCTAEEWYWKVPFDEKTAISELKKLVMEGATYIVIAWPAYWWLDERQALRNYLNSNHKLLMDNDRVLVFELKPS